MSVEVIWQRIEGWLQEHAPAVLSGLRAGGTRDEIRAIETTIGSQLPTDVIESYQIHDGQYRDPPGLFYGWELLSLQHMLEEWKVWKDVLDAGGLDDAVSNPQDAVRPVWWGPKWIPFTSDGTGNSLCIDLDPDRAGHEGQVVAVWHAEPSRNVVAPSFRSWLEDQADELESRAYVFVERYGGLFRADDI